MKLRLNSSLLAITLTNNHSWKFNLKTKTNQQLQVLISNPPAPTRAPGRQIHTHSNGGTTGAIAITRHNFATLNSTHLNYFEKTLGKTGISTSDDELAKYNVDFFHSVKGTSKLVLKPKTTLEVSEILKYCNKEVLAICPQGGNTGVVGGGIPVFDEIVLSMERMNKVISVDEMSGSCQIGGNISTNAGGLRLLKYGNLHGNVLGLEAVLPNGSVLNSITGMRKDNTGYAVKNLFIGSEGTLGVVTTVALQCAPKPKAVNVAFLGLKSYKDVLEIHQMAKNELGEILSAFEYMDETILKCVTENLKLKLPFEEFPFYALIETSGSNSGHDEEKLHAFLRNVMEKVSSAEGTIASDLSQKNALWSLRERMTEALLSEGFLYIYDLSIPISTFDDLVRDVRNRLGSSSSSSSVIRCAGFGHLGDGNIHLAATSPKFDDRVLSCIEPYVYDWVSKLNGSVSAEHGLGFLKRKYLGYTKSPEMIQIMRELKKSFDPNGILNPYKVFE